MFPSPFPGINWGHKTFCSKTQPSFLWVSDTDLQCMKSGSGTGLKSRRNCSVNRLQGNVASTQRAPQPTRALLGSQACIHLGFWAGALASCRPAPGGPWGWPASSTDPGWAGPGTALLNGCRSYPAGVWCPRPSLSVLKRLGHPKCQPNSRFPEHTAPHQLLPWRVLIPRGGN